MEGRVKHIYYKSETTLPFMTADDMNCFLVGGSDDNIATENGLKFRVDWLKGQKTGFFVDQRENRSLLEKFSKGKRVLNMFCYTGGFSFYAMRGGAELVHSVDSSAKAIELTKQNVELNFPGDARHEAYCEDAFKYLERAGSNYNLIILDPPAFTKSGATVKSAFRGYKEINLKAMKLLPRGGYLATCSCSHFMKEELFVEMLHDAAAEAHVQLRQIEARQQAPDHPVLWNVPETNYLKFYIFQVV
jgi:23S rRNA (cytosine1962-C5)-methyltransferase